jgi:hypothetical protein
MFMLISLPLDQTTANAAETVYATVPAGGPSKWVVRGAEFTPDTSRTADNTNYATVAVKVGSTTLGSFTTQITGNGDLTAGTPVAFTLTGAEAAVHTASASHINVAVTKTASGLAVTGTVTVLIEAVRA